MKIESLVFLTLMIFSIFLFSYNLRKIIRNINLGKDLDRNDQPIKRLKTMVRVALGQSKMVVRPVAGFLHILVYIGFVVINIEIIEIIIDGIIGSHRVFFKPFGNVYIHFINLFEILALLVLVACIIFLIRRNVLMIKRFHNSEMTLWPKSDANLILIFEIFLMTAFLFMNAADSLLMSQSNPSYVDLGLEKYMGFNIAKDSFLVSGLITGFLPDNLQSLHFIERFCWWFHILGIFIFINYLPYSKHLHIFFAFPNTYFSNLQPKGQFTNMEAVTKEVKMMLEPNSDSFASSSNNQPIERFGAKDAIDLNWVQLMNAYSCTECGRCTSECPANQTGKKLSPRKIMMDTRDRIEEIGLGVSKKGKGFSDGKSLLNDYITKEELWACTSCNACTQACPINIDPLSIITDMRRYLVMEESAAPNELNLMFNNIENNGAPWQFASLDRLNWKDE